MITVDSGVSLYDGYTRAELNSQNLAPDPITGALASPIFAPLSFLTGETDQWIATHSQTNNVVQCTTLIDSVSQVNATNSRTKNAVLDADSSDAKSALDMIA